ncbi:MAG: hypothetical protein ACI4L7_01640 [Christensenellales bacterium]
MRIREVFNRFFRSKHKILLTSLLSSITTLLFAIYNGYLGLRFGDVWGTSIAIYYLCLTVARTICLSVEKKLKGNEEDYRNIIRRKTYIGLSIFIFFIDICLFVPITLMVVSPKEVSFGTIPAITVATYTTYKIIMAIVNYNKTKKLGNLTYIFLRELSMIDALISILSLQHILIMVNGGMTNDMLILSAISSFAILTIIILFSFFTTKKMIKKT